MRAILIKFVSLVAIVAGMSALASAPASACPGGYHPCGNFCCPGN